MKKSEEKGWEEYWLWSGTPGLEIECGCVAVGKSDHCGPMLLPLKQKNQILAEFLCILDEVMNMKQYVKFKSILQIFS